MTNIFEKLPDLTTVAGESPIIIPGANREALIYLFRDLGFQVGAEIGVERGYYSAAICERVPNLKLFCVDAWKAYRGYREHVTQAKLDALYAEAGERLRHHNTRLVRLPSLAAAREIQNDSLDFVYIDANHRLEQVIADLAAWVPKVRPGGIVSGHDYDVRRGKGYINHVGHAVTAWTRSYNVQRWYVLGAHGEPTCDRSRSFFWVKDV
jgi:predicted O-methyltransferase YrrM